MVGGNPGAKLPKSFPDDFFRHPTAREEEPADTLESVQALIEKNQKEASDLKNRFEKLQTEALEAAQAKKKLEEGQAAVDAQAQVVAEAQKKLAELQAELDEDE